MDRTMGLRLAIKGRPFFVILTVAKCLLLLSLASAVGARRKWFQSSWAVEVEGGREVADAVAANHGMINLGQVGNLEGVWYFTLERGALTKDFRGEKLSEKTATLEEDGEVRFVEQQEVFQRAKRTGNFYYPTDQYWTRQWSLFNSGQAGGASGRDINVVPAWIQGYTGKGVVVSIVDDGIESDHSDLIKNFDATASYNFVMNTTDPSPSSSDAHGTSCAGIVAMARDNYYCGAGVAYNARVGGIQFDMDRSTDIIEAQALSFKHKYIDVYSNSWGPSDAGFIVGGPGTYTKQAIVKGIQKGRNGLGSVFVWASGNGGHFGDSCAADGFVSSIYTIGVGSIDQKGRQAFYDENCSGKMAVAYSYNSAGYYHVTTTALKSTCTSSFSGTSASAPQLAGITALALEANSSLTWRDIQYLVVYTSNPEPVLSYGNWAINGAGHLVSHEFGFGVLDAEALVTRARHWITVPSQEYCVISSDDYDGESTSGDPLSIEFYVSDDNCANIVFLEHVVVEITLTINSDDDDDDYKDYGYIDYYYDPGVIYHKGPRRGDISITLTSPAGTVSTLLPERRDDYVNDEGYKSWPFMSVHHWGEEPEGKWLLHVNFSSSSGYVAVDDLNMILYGTSQVPESVFRIPDHCSALCERGCAASGDIYCDSCRKSRMPDTLRCVEKCPSGFCDIDGYCVRCDSPFLSPAATVGIAVGAVILLAMVALGIAAGIVLPRIYMRHCRNYENI